MENLADLYNEGKECEKNIEKANFLYKKVFDIIKLKVDLNFEEGSFVFFI